MFIEERIRENVESFIKKNGTSDPEEIIRSMKNIDFAYEPLSKNLNGYYLCLSEKRQIIRVNENLEGLRKQYALFHELSHYISGHRGKLLLNSITTISNIKEEYEADLSATYFLVVHNDISKDNIHNFVLPDRASVLINRFM